MTQRARDADRFQVVTLEEAPHADDGIELDEGHRYRGIVKIDRVLAQRTDDLSGQCVHVYLQPQIERSLRSEAAAHAAEALALERALEVQRTAPEILIAEGIEPEGLAARRERTLRVSAYLIVEACRGIRALALSTHLPQPTDTDYQRGTQHRTDHRQLADEPAA